MIRLSSARAAAMGLFAAAVLGLAIPGAAQEAATPDTTAPADTTTAAATTADTTTADTTTAAAPSRARRARAALGRDTHRIEVGAAVADGPFDAFGTLAYHRYVRTGGPFENWVHAELAGSKTSYLDEGAVSLGYLLRPLFLIRREGAIRPILEAGPAAHLVVQVAEVQGFGETVFHSHAYLKTHAYAGFDVLLGGGWGIVARGRFTVPAHRPLDYAQIAVFFR